MFNSRVINTDPKPYYVAETDSRHTSAEIRESSTERECGGTLYNLARFDPRAEFNNAPNPILLYLREAMTRPGSAGLVLAYVAEEQLYSIHEAQMFGAMETYGFHATPDQIEHARHVLTRLAGPAKRGEV